MPNILVSTFGTSWAVAAELLAITGNQIDFLDNNENITAFKRNLESKDIHTIDELWLICTQGNHTNNAIEAFQLWLNALPEITFPKIHYLSLAGLEDLTNEEECKQMADFIYRVILKANEQKKQGKLLLSLTGGRKTMSTDMQRAADIFGCDVLLHIADSFDSKFKITLINDFLLKLPAEKAKRVNVVEVVSNKRNSYLADVAPKLLSENYPIEFNRNNVSQIYLYNEIANRLTTSESLHYNAYNSRTKISSQSIFHGLQQLNPSILDRLDVEKPDIAWLKKIPKADLHCHFGGILDAAGIIQVAQSSKYEIEQQFMLHPEFKEWFLAMGKAVEQKDDKLLKPYILDKHKLRDNLFPIVNKPLVVCAFILAFENHLHYFEQLIYGSFIENKHFKNIGITQYELLGDLQGSALMQSEATISKACEILKSYCIDHNLKYLELRCSPCNYTKGGLAEMQVIDIMHKHLANFRECDIRIIIIGSRHGEMDIFKRHVQLATNLLRDKKYREFVVGFDVAGNEQIAKPSELRNILLPLLKECLHLTIHAGEDQPVENIWEAVYELNADRIGHGLTLINNADLLHRFRDKNIVIELCPSSNFQICDYEHRDYPLRRYLSEGLKVTLNTDNPGISRTSITNEYAMMAHYANLTKMEIIQLVRNSFQAVFLPKNKKKELIIRIEEAFHKQLAES